MTDTSREALTPTLTPILCDKCGIETPDPWHSSEGANKHIHTCDACHAQQVAVPVPLTDGEIDAVTISQWGEMHGQPLAAHRAFARAIEARLGITQQGDAPCNVYWSYSLGGLK